MPQRLANWRKSVRLWKNEQRPWKRHGKSGLLLISFLMITFSAACTSIQGDFCGIATEITPNQAAVLAMDGITLRQVHAHNCIGKKICGWDFDGCD